jgi:hypothetical protein
VERSLINLCATSLRLHADKSRNRGEIKSRTVVRLFRLTSIHLMKAACPLRRQVVLTERMWPLRDSWKQCAFEAQYYVLYIISMQKIVSWFFIVLWGKNRRMTTVITRTATVITRTVPSKVL